MVVVERPEAVGASGHPDLCCVVSPMALFVGGSYISLLVGSFSLSWSFALT
jgi:hypothetical protein